MQLRTEIEIAASPQVVWNVLADFARYHEWNPFVTRVDGALREGAHLEVTLSLPESSDLEIHPSLLVVRPAEELRWRGTMLAGFLLAGEHFFQLEPTDAGGTRLVHGEDFSGILVRFLGKKLTETVRGFVYMNTALKRRVEGL